MPSLYLETSVVGYLTSRFSRDPVTTGRQQLTRDWWRTERHKYEVFISQFVVDESEQGDADAAAERRTILADPPLLVPAKLADRLTTELIRLVPFPSKAVVDAAHIAVAAANGMEYLMTWNFKHIANAALRDRIAWVCRSQGVEVPVICTPEELFEASQ